MKCPKCSTKNPTDSKFCNECGTELTLLSVTKTLQKPPASPGKTIAGKYKILSELGRGGMGVVYKAKDTRLKRTVALKFLPAELTKDKEAKKRFIQEAQAAAALNHPQICTIYEVDEADNQTFIAMEYIEGQSLKDRLKEGPLAIDEAKDIALKVAEGLKEAHEKGIVHRDIKPANIMLTKKGQAKITDFGLAKLSWGVDLTKTSTIMGTVAYMSPEQARGEEVDHRTDIWALGAMLYEMLTSERPFKKDKEHALIYSILNDEPKPIAEIRQDIPNHIESAIYKALDKDASNRYQSIQQLMEDLKQSAPIMFPKAEKSIVVLPFENLSPDPEQEYFCDGMTEEIISDLSSIHSVRVISRNTAMVYKGTKKTTKAIGRELDVGYVLEGSVRKAGNNLRITAQLIDARNDAHLWAEKYTGTLDDVFDIQEKVSLSILEALQLQLTPQEVKGISERPIDNVQAYEFYLRAQKEIWRWTEDGFERAFQLIKAGMKIEGENELLYAAMGDAYCHTIQVFVRRDDEDLFQKAEECVQKIFTLNPESSHGHYIKGFINWMRGNVQQAVRDMKKALLVDPNNTQALMNLCWLYLIVGKEYAGRPLIKKALEVDPLNPTLWLWYSAVDMFEGKFEVALKSSQFFYELESDNTTMRLFYAWFLSFAGLIDKACEILSITEKEAQEDIYTQYSLVTKYALMGNKKKVMEFATEEFKKTFQKDEWFPIVIAALYALIGEKEEAIDWLEHGVNWGFANYHWLMDVGPHLDNIRGEPRFKKLMERVKHEWENFEV